ncbi:hypothetical protein RA2_01022 [Roseovarius sp. A-2]|uniref:hypothetical protein n=1 Tax=Roseovarius sp. A-2 TaxID=1570360 RepID=UPI0009B59550|nr:hypothetical protein [Roseovarius sp. A-2]GAW33977.1 hypothetical protein RA2_01022 [Roseovarius sp. A-2]
MLDEDVEVVLAASSGRRVIGVGSVAMLGLILLYLALVQSPGLGWQVFMVGFGTLALWLALRMWRATTLRLELSPAGLRCSDGRVVAPMDDIIGVARGAFAFKPSNGFMIKMSRAAPFAWEPGLWWRIGRRVGVGGVTPATPAKVMAEILQDRINLRGVD